MRVKRDVRRILMSRCTVGWNEFIIHPFMLLNIINIMRWLCPFRPSSLSAVPAADLFLILASIQRSTNYTDGDMLSRRDMQRIRTWTAFFFSEAEGGTRSWRA